MPSDFILAYKKIGETPLACLERVREEKSLSKTLPMTYAGRLDPMAEGLLIILTGDTCKDEEKKEYLALDKTYEAKIVLGVSTDTYDLLGLVTNIDPNYDQESVREKIKSILQDFVGTFSQVYPPYSSKTVDGKQLFTHAREGSEVDLPQHEVSIYNIDVVDYSSITSATLLKYIKETIPKVVGDFRQEEIVEKWRETLDPAFREFLTLSLTISCGSGMYVRQLVDDFGKKLDYPAVLYSLKRTKIGEFSL